MYMAGREGAAAVVRRGPTFKLLALNKLDDGFDASPVVVDNELYLRGRKHLYRVSKDQRRPLHSPSGCSTRPVLSPTCSGCTPIRSSSVRKRFVIGVSFG